MNLSRAGLLAIRGGRSHGILSRHVPPHIRVPIAVAMVQAATCSLRPKGGKLKLSLHRPALAEYTRDVSGSVVSYIRRDVLFRIIPRACARRNAFFLADNALKFRVAREKVSTAKIRSLGIHSSGASYRMNKGGDSVLSLSPSFLNRSAYRAFVNSSGRNISSFKNFLNAGIPLLLSVISRITRCLIRNQFLILWFYASRVWK